MITILIYYGIDIWYSPPRHVSGNTMVLLLRQNPMEINVCKLIHCPPKVWKRPRKWGFGQYWHESFLICDNFALIRDNTNYENILYYINSLYIEKT